MCRWLSLFLYSDRKSTRKGVSELPQAAFDYHYGLDAERYAFFRIPKILMTEPYFDTLSTDAKLLYGLMLDRMSLSRENGWIDDEQRVYIYFTQEEACHYLHCKTDKAVKLFAELDTIKGFGLIERIRQGQGKPARIYVKRYLGTEIGQTSEKTKSAPRKKRSQENGKSEVMTKGKSKSALRKNPHQDFGKSESNNTKKNNTDFSKTDLSIYPAVSSPMDVIGGYREQIKSNIEYDYLTQKYPYDDLDEIVDLMLEVLCTQEDFVKIGNKQVFTVLARERFLKLDSCHIEYVLDCMRNTTSDIRNIKAYLLETLFNASATSGNYYRAKVNHDFHSTG